jgi:Zn-dependent M28 family amino/carboxypeptidase
VLALLPGSDPELADEYIVMTAHLDGLGLTEAVNGDSVNNGALDNAAGVAALLDMAGQLRGQRRRRSILFAFVTAEELGAARLTLLCGQSHGAARGDRR